MNLELLCKGVVIDGQRIVPSHSYCFEGIQARGVALCPHCMKVTCTLTGMKTTNEIQAYKITYTILEG